MTMSSTDILQANLNNMKDNFDNFKKDFKEDFNSFKKEVRDIVPQITNILKTEYVNKDQFDPYKKKIDNANKMIISVILVVIGLVLTYVFNVFTK